MIQDKIIASEISQLMIECSAKIDATVAQVQNKCNEEEFNLYRKAAGKVMGEMLLEIMNPIYKTHPELKPKGLNS